jgi:hypothetical protein
MNLRNNTGEFVTEHTGWDEHSGVIATTVNLEVSSTGQCGFNTDSYLAGSQWLFWNVLHSELLSPIQDSGFQSV